MATTKFFAEALKQTMKERRMNQAQLAEYLSVDPAYISRWLRGASPRLGQLVSCLEKIGDGKRMKIVGGR